MATGRAKTPDIQALLQRPQRLAVLLDVSQRLAGTLDLKVVLQATVDGVAKLADLDTAAVYLLEQDHITLWATTPPLPPTFPEALRRAPLEDHPRLSRAIREAAPVLLPDMPRETLTPAERAVQEQRRLRTVLFLPLVADREVVGALVVGSTDEPTELPGEDVDLCGTLANLAALAVRNAELYRTQQRYADQLERTLAEREAAEAERAVLQRQLAQSQKLETVGRLAGGVAHDFNNMLTAIHLNAELALKMLPPGAELQRPLLDIQSATERSAMLTSQLLAFAKSQPAVPQALDMNHTVSCLLPMLTRLIREEITIHWSPGDALWAVSFDPSQLDQILVNLCVNARDALPGGGHITIETANVPRDEALTGASLTERPDFAPQDYVELTVRDDGCGMVAETREKVFEPFFTTKAPGKGTGLGLATVYGIVRQNRGFIQVESQPDQGTTIRIWLPRLAEPQAEVAAPTPTASGQRGNERVLVVEDEPMVLTLSRRFLERSGYRVVASTSAREALRMVVEDHVAIQLLVTDVVMPEMSGWELADALLEHQPGLKVLFVSGYASDGALQDGRRLEDSYFLSKPYSGSALIAKVREVLDL